MMHYRLVAAGLAAGGGLLTAAFLQAAVAVAAPGDDATVPSATGANAFTLDGFTFDPFNSTTGEEGFSLVRPFVGAAPLLTLGGGNATDSPLPLVLAPQQFEVFGADGTDLASINSSVFVTNLAGFTNTQFTVLDVTAAADSEDGDPAELPTVGSVYDVLNFGGGFANIYTAVVGTEDADGNVGDTVITDTFVTPFGNIDLTDVFDGIDMAAPLQPGDAFTALQAGASGGGEDAFAIGGLTLDPFTGSGASAVDGFAPVTALGGMAPLLAVGGGAIAGHLGGVPLAAVQDFEVFSGNGDDATQIGTIHTAVDVTNLLGMTNTQLVVIGGSGAGDDIPAFGTVYDAFNFGGGFTNVYIATPGDDGADTTITDTLITPLGNMDLSWLFAGMGSPNSLDAGTAFDALGVSAGSEYAFAVGGTTFDPYLGLGASGADGFNLVNQTIGGLPLLNIGGGAVDVGVVLTAGFQHFNVYDGTGADAALLGKVYSDESVIQLLGLTTTQFTITDVFPSDGDEADLPVLGSVYSVLNLGGGFANVYTAIPGLDGADSTVTDTFVTPFGDIDLSGLFGGFDASSWLDPAGAFLGLDI